MQRLLLYLGFILLLATPACKKDNGKEDLINVGAYLQAGSWRVAQFVESGQDETGNFTGYSFTFASTGTVTATNGGTTVTGYWGSTVDEDRSKVQIVFTSPATFQDLTSDWQVLASGTNRIGLQDVSGGNGGTDVLVLERD